MGEIAEHTEAMRGFVADKGFFLPASPHHQTPANIAKSLVIEAAEVLDCFQWVEEPDVARLAPELADVFLY
jgi:NTP pyrophosphatase (non-canonical NTP hydrolase)